MFVIIYLLGVISFLYERFPRPQTVLVESTYLLATYLGAGRGVMKRVCGTNIGPMYSASRCSARRVVLVTSSMVNLNQVTNYHEAMFK